MARYSPEPNDGGYYAYSQLPDDPNGGGKSLRIFFGHQAEIDPLNVILVDEERQYIVLTATDIKGRLMACDDEIVTYKLHGPVLVVPGDGNDPESIEKLNAFNRQWSVQHYQDGSRKFFNGATVIRTGQE